MEDTLNSDSEYDDNNSYYDYDYGDEEEDEEEEDYAVSVIPKNPTTVKAITRESLLTAQMDDLTKVMDLLSLKIHNARRLLVHHRWDIDKILSVFGDKGKDVLFAQAGVKVLDHNNNLVVPSSIKTCYICFEDVQTCYMTTMDCGHFFCNDCWTEHFVVNINEGLSRSIKCMSHECNTICDEAKISFLVGTRDADLADKFDRFLLESYIEDNDRVKWCPSVPHCGNAIHIKDDEVCEVECVCGFQFCFNCSFEAHSPCTCMMWQSWAKKCQDESETVKWIIAHTKPCPKCNKLVEKSDGCNLVVCVCKQPFCWLCGGATGREHTWTSISGHSCGRFQEECETAAKNAKRDLQRYIHYHSRYQAHADSLKLESKLEEATKSKISELEEKKISTTLFDWVKNGFSRLFRSRRVLSYTYPFAYYMFGDELFRDEMTKEERLIKQNLFEDQQQQFEANVEKLSSLLGEEFHLYEDEKLLQFRQRVIDLSNLTDTLCQNLYDCIAIDILGSLKWSVHEIAPYNSNGLTKASELSQ
ncbi:hypothetical protein ACFE04_012644 [Oxalis oulophora]